MQSSRKREARIYTYSMNNAKTSKKKYFIFLVLYFVLFSFYFTSNTLSKYMGRAYGNANTSAAKWEIGIDDTGAQKNFEIVSGNTVNYTLRVKSESEVSNTYTITLTNVPSDVSVSIDGGTPIVPVSGKVEFPNEFSFNASTSRLTRDHTLSFFTTLNTNAVTNNEIGIQVNFVQDEL